MLEFVLFKSSLMKFNLIESASEFSFLSVCLPACLSSCHSYRKDWDQAFTGGWANHGEGLCEQTLTAPCVKKMQIWQQQEAPQFLCIIHLLEGGGFEVSKK